MASVIERIESGEITVAVACDGKLRQDIRDEIIALAKLGEKMRWIPVGERLPEEEDIYLVFIQCNGESAVLIEDFFYRFSSHVTHWMPLPDPPREEC